MPQQHNGGVNVDGVSDVQEELQGRSSRAADWTPIQDDIRDTFIEGALEMFRTDGGSEGQSWAGYGGEPKYAAYKMAITGHNDLLRWEKGGPHERLYPSLTQHGSDNQVWQTEGPLNFRFGSAAESALDVLKGGRGPFGESSPARDFLPTGPRTKENIAELVSAFVNEDNGG